MKAPITLLAILLLSAQAAFACPMLDRAEPKVGSEVDAAPDHVSVHFTSKIYPTKSTLDVTDSDGHPVSTGKPYGDDLTISTKLKPLGTGKYKVTWHVLCDCGSITPGDYKFTVR